MRELRIHHFFDIIRDYGSDKALKEHANGHAYHMIGNEIFENKITKVRLVINGDDICEICQKLSLGKCTDTIQHRSDFKYKEDFNNHLDSRIMNHMGYEVGQVIEVKEIIKNADRYLDGIFNIYDGNDIDHTEQRKEHVSSGIEKKRSELGL